MCGRTQKIRGKNKNKERVTYITPLNKLSSLPRPFVGPTIAYVRTLVTFPAKNSKYKINKNGTSLY